MSIIENNSNDKEYEIEKIIGKRIQLNGKIEYKVKWLGYYDFESTWEPEEQLFNAKEAIQDFENEIKLKEFQNKNFFHICKKKRKTSDKVLSDKNSLKKNCHCQNLKKSFINKKENIMDSKKETIILGDDESTKNNSEKNDSSIIIEKKFQSTKKEFINKKRKKKKSDLNLISFSSKSSLKNENVEKNKKKYKILNIKGIYILRGKLFAKTTIIFNNQKIIAFILTKKIWNLNPMMLISYYEKHIKTTMK